MLRSRQRAPISICNTNRMAAALSGAAAFLCRPWRCAPVRNRLLGFGLQLRALEEDMFVRTMALDIGEVRIGVAISDSEGRVATPLKVLSASDVLNDGAEFRRLVQDWEVEQLLCGLPYTLAGEEGPQAASIKEKAKRIARARDLPLFFVDERMSSREAKRILREEGLDERAMRGKVDMIAASLFLQAWLDAQIEHEDK